MYDPTERFEYPLCPATGYTETPEYLDIVDKDYDKYEARREMFGAVKRLILNWIIILRT